MFSPEADARPDATEASAPSRPPVVLTPVAILANRKSGTNARDAEAIDRAMAVFGDDARLHHWDTEQDLGALADKAIAGGARTIIAAGGDGTAMAVAQAVLGKDVAFGVLPLGTFNYFARGLGLPEEASEAARALLAGTPHEIRIGTVDGQVFLNNASLGIYPRILKEREDVYARWGRRRLMAHWSVIRTFWRFQRPMRMRLTADGAVQDVRTPLLFVARSAYQLEIFGLEGAEAIHDDAFAVLVGRGETRAELFRLAWRLITRRMQPGRDYDLLAAKHLVVETAKPRMLVAFDGEKRPDRSPFTFHMEDRPLRLLLPGPRQEAPA
ncbi:NAD(+)/NADH kinase [Pseudooceanicola sp. CBS1P-1]|uniref:DAGKc domain-containing protein n=2 Tax=Paracoccaceae TaxID=31989 RepID=A0A6L7G7Y2_9RHOB|nr:NAD(+)/NADH kinase [Pseudooceanicola endophyticus]MXN19707.1 hypothetical protein [Pseudooceanicola albus]